MLDERQTTFLGRPRLGMFSTSSAPGWSRPVPVWFDAGATAVRLFSGATAPKVARLRAEPRAHLLAANHLDETEAWVSVAGAVELHPVDGAWLEALTARYWDLGDPGRRRELDGWLAHLDALVGVTLRPDEVHAYGV